MCDPSACLPSISLLTKWESHKASRRQSNTSPKQLNLLNLSIDGTTLRKPSAATSNTRTTTTPPEQRPETPYSSKHPSMVYVSGTFTPPEERLERPYDSQHSSTNYIPATGSPDELRLETPYSSRHPSSDYVFGTALSSPYRSEVDHHSIHSSNESGYHPPLRQLVAQGRAMESFDTAQCVRVRFRLESPDSDESPRERESVQPTLSAEQSKPRRRVDSTETDAPAMFEDVDLRDPVSEPAPSSEPPRTNSSERMKEMWRKVERARRPGLEKRQRRKEQKEMEAAALMTGLGRRHTENPETMHEQLEMYRGHGSI